MYAAQRNLMVVFAQEYLGFDDSVLVVVGFSGAIQHMHELKRMHIDIKPLNAVRMPDGTW